MVMNGGEPLSEFVDRGLRYQSKVQSAIDRKIIDEINKEINRVLRLYRSRQITKEQAIETLYNAPMLVSAYGEPSEPVMGSVWNKIVDTVERLEYGN